MHKMIHCDLPYPSLEGVTEDRRSATIIAPAYAGLHSELTAILQYNFHHYYFKTDFPEIAELLEGISIAEMHHLDTLGELLKRLGVSPVLTQCPPEKCRFFNTSTVSCATDPQKMLMDNLHGEINAICAYREMVTKLTNEQVQAIISRIILDEEVHVFKLKEALETVIMCYESKKPILPGCKA